MEEVKNNSGQSLGIAALITAIITFVIAVIPCVGMVAWVPGLIAIILGGVGLSQAARNNSPRGVPLAGLIIGVVAFMISISQFFVAGRIFNHADKWPRHIENIVNDVQQNVLKELEDKNINIKVESNGDTVQIVTSTSKKDNEKTLEDLEKTDTVTIKIKK